MQKVTQKLVDKTTKLWNYKVIDFLVTKMSNSSILSTPNIGVGQIYVYDGIEWKHTPEGKTELYFFFENKLVLIVYLDVFVGENEILRRFYPAPLTVPA